MPNGKICYVEIPTTDAEAAAKFYAAVFGWTTRKRGDGALAFDDTTGQVSGSVHTQRTEIGPGGDAYALFLDSSDNLFGLYQGPPR